jgi:predicted TIM-barrel fold metal-dependent hydrolase
MAQKHIHREELIGKIIDAHTHAGIDLKAFAQIGFPYSCSIEGLYYRMKCFGVNYAVVFPMLGAQLFFNVREYVTTGKLVPAKKPISKVPYEIENKMLLTEIFDFCPELKNHFIPFVMVDPGRKVKEQIEVIRNLEQSFPIYGIKISPVGCQSKVTKLLEEGKAFLEFAKERDWPILLHVTVSKGEEFSQASDAFKVIERYPELRYCLAHCIGLHRGFLERANEMPNVWVDTAALKIQVEMTYKNSPLMAQPHERFDWDYSDHVKVMKALVNQFPKKILWGSDCPYYSYIVRRMQAEGVYVDFRLKGTYEDEKVAFDALSSNARKQICSNTIKFIFG